MTPNLFIRFKGNLPEDDSQIALAELGESLVGFDSVLKEFARILRIQGELEIRASSPKRGSVIFQIAAQLDHASLALLFSSIGDFLDFLKVAADPTFHQAHDFFNSIENAHKTLNDWASKHPVDFAVLSALFAKAALMLFKKARKNKDTVDYSDKEIPKRVAEELHKLIGKHGFKKALKPIVEDKVESIEVSCEKAFAVSVKVDHGSLQDYLAEDEQILPHLQNGSVCKLTGTVTSLKGTRGDSLTLQIEHGGETFNLDTLPAQGATSKSYKDLYKEAVNVEAEVIRKSLYQKPKLKLQSINRVQSVLGLTADGKDKLTDSPKST